MKDPVNEIKIPPLSLVTVQMMQFDPMSAEASSAALERIITPDKGVSAEILRVANSSFYGRSGSVKTLRDAITLLGLKSVKNLAILLSTRSLNVHIKGPVLRRYIREFPIATALTAQDLAGKLKREALREEIFVGALLHKIGMTVLALNHEQKYSNLLEFSEKEGLDFREEEKRAFGVDHMDLAAELAERWKLPPDLREIMTRHQFAAEDTAAVSDPVRITALASLCAREMMGLLLPMSELDRRARIAAHYNAGEIISQIDERYYNGLREHPFFKQSVSD